MNETMDKAMNEVTNGTTPRMMANEAALAYEAASAVGADNEAAPIEAAPVEAPPVEAAPVEAPPVEAPPAEAPPVEAAPVEAAPVEAAPVEAAPVSTPSTEVAPPTSAVPLEGLRLRMKVWTERSTGKRYLMPSAFMRDVVRGQPVTDVMYAYAMRDDDTKLVTMTATEWNALPFFYFKEDGSAPRATSRPIDVVVSSGKSP